MGRTAASDIDRLIEMGLNRYGAGDLDGAIFLWEEALAIDPDNAQATSYIDYVRLNYDLLTNGEPSVEDSVEARYAIEEEPEYQIEVSPGEVELPPAAAIVSLDPVDMGWFVDEATHDAGAQHAEPEPDGDAEAYPENITLELEADEPPLSASEQNFEGPTREFHGDQPVPEPAPTPPPKLDDLDLDDGTAGPTMGFYRGDDGTGGSTQGYFRGDEATEYGEEGGNHEHDFNPQGTPVGFANLETEVRKRDFGFVQPVAAPTPVADKPSSPISIGTAPTMDYVALGETQERAPFAHGAPPPDDDDPSADDLLESLPTPRPAPSTAAESGEFRLPPTTTRDMPESPRLPARRDLAALSQAEVMLGHAPTRELSSLDTRAGAGDGNPDPVISAPTRELGLRQLAQQPADRNFGDEDDAPTRQSDVRAIRAAAARNDGAQEREGTRHDLVLSFDPIAARTAQILDEVDAETPAGEPAEEQTRRRITRLLEKAGEWADAGELDKAVAAVDLALSEDPNSALAQKLITRNRDTITSLFQTFLGDLDRSPQLAKPLHELSKEPISPRAAFLLSRIDGMLTIDELLDVSGMPRLEAYRHLCQLVLRGILR